MINDRTIQSRIITKRHKLETCCYYGLSHFCDGKPNKSEDPLATPLPKCPNYYSCAIRNKSIFSEKEDMFDF